MLVSVGAGVCLVTTAVNVSVWILCFVIELINSGPG